MKTYTLEVRGTGPCPLSAAHKLAMRDGFRDALIDTYGRGLAPFDPEVCCDDHGAAAALLTFKVPPELADKLLALNIGIQEARS